MASTLNVEINRWAKGWNVDTLVKWDGWAHPAKTCQGATTLAWALWKALDITRFDKIIVEDIKVNGKTVSVRDAFNTISDKFSSTALAYDMPVLKKALNLEG